MVTLMWQLGSKCYQTQVFVSKKKCYVSLITQTEAQKSLPATGQKQWESTLLTLFDQQ